MGWSRLAGSVTTVDIPGDHTSILRPPGVDRLAEAMRAEIERSEGVPEPSAAETSGD
jgi:hypothetical protein